jgi:hypothetical protein
MVEAMKEKEVNPLFSCNKLTIRVSRVLVGEFSRIIKLRKLKNKYLRILIREFSCVEL